MVYAQKEKLTLQDREFIRIAMEALEGYLDATLPVLADEEILFVLRKSLRKLGRESNFMKSL